MDSLGDIMKSSPMPLLDRLELAAQACRAAHLLSCEATCREAITALQSLSQESVRSEALEGVVRIFVRPALERFVEAKHDLLEQEDLKGELQLNMQRAETMLEDALEELRALSPARVAKGEQSSKFNAGPERKP